MARGESAYRLLETSAKRARETLRPPATGKLLMPLSAGDEPRWLPLALLG
jgi:hypothetical protein